MEKRTGKELSHAELVKVLMPAVSIFNLSLLVTWCFSKDIAIIFVIPYIYIHCLPLCQPFKTDEVRKQNSQKLLNSALLLENTITES